MECHFQWNKLPELDAPDWHKVMMLRQQVFVVEQNCAYLDADNADYDALHLQALIRDDLVGYLRLLAPGNDRPAPAIGRVLVAKKARGSGLARQLMKLAIEHAQLLWPDRQIVLSAQTYLVQFYESLGFSCQGEQYLEDGIPHINMWRPGSASES